MPQEIKTIDLPLPFRSGSVNCYLLKEDSHFILIDTGYSNNRTQIVNELTKAGCNTSNLKLIILTHGDFDHVGNAAYLRTQFSSKIAMHYDDSGMVEYGDMFWNRKVNRVVRLVGKVLSILPPFRLSKSNRFTPDLFIVDGYSLLGYGINARVFSIPGHSKGSLGILTSEGDLFCGDLFVNDKGPTLNTIIDNPEAANSSVEKLKAAGTKTVYPGHGTPFLLDALVLKKQ